MRDLPVFRRPLPRRLASWVVAMGMFAGLTVFVAGPARADWVPPTPVKKDAYGTKFDRFLLPQDDGTGWMVNGEPAPSSSWISTGGAATVAVTALNYIDPEVTFTLTFGTEDDAGAAQARNTMRVTVGECLDERYRRVTAWVTNTADMSGWPTENLYVVMQSEDGFGQGGPGVFGIEDGQTRGVLLGPSGNKRMFANGKFEYWDVSLISGEGRLAAPTVRIRLRSCRKSPPAPVTTSRRPRIGFEFIHSSGPDGPTRLGAATLHNRAKFPVTFTTAFQDCGRPATVQKLRVAPGRWRAVKHYLRPRPISKPQGTITVTYRYQGKKYTKRSGTCP